MGTLVRLETLPDLVELDDEACGPLFLMVRADQGIFAVVPEGAPTDATMLITKNVNRIGIFCLKYCVYFSLGFIVFYFYGYTSDS